MRLQPLVRTTLVFLSVNAVVLQGLLSINFFWYSFLAKQGMDGSIV